MPADDCIEVARERRAAVRCEVRAADGDDRRVRLSFSSEEPVERDFGWEVLGHGPGEVDLSRIATGRAPLLEDHRADLEHQIGIIDSVEIVDNRGLAIVRFGKSARAAEILERVRDGEIVSVSVGYHVDVMRSDGERDGQPVYRATKWTLIEISLVSLAADGSVGIGREAGSAGTLTVRKAQRMPDDTQAPPAEPRGSDNRAVKAERHRVAEITAMARQFDISDEVVTRAIEEGTSDDAFRRVVLDHLGREEAPATRAGATRIAHGMNNFGGHRDQQRVQDASLAKLVRAQIDGDWSDAGLEREMLQEERRRVGRSAEGVHIPALMLADQRRQAGAPQHRADITSSNAGALIGTEHLHGSFIDVLAPNAAVRRLGATMLPGLVQNVEIPRKTSTSSAQWLAENAAATESTPGFDNVPLSMKQLSATATWTRKMVKQALPVLDSIMRAELRAEIERKLDLAAIAGAGTATEPEGILNNASVPVLALGTNGGAPVWQDVVDLTSLVAEADAARGRLGWLTNSKVASVLMTTKKDAGSGIFILDESNAGRMAGRAVEVSSLVPSNLTKGTGSGLSAMIFGNWADLLIGQWGGIDLIVDDVTESAKGNVRITIHSEWDIAVRHPESFAVMNDIITG